MQKNEFTSFDVAAVVRELREIATDSRVNNIYQLDSMTLLLKLHKTNELPSNLILEAGKRLHLTLYTHEKPQTPPVFCMALRKLLRNGRLTNIEQREFERVITLSFKTRNGTLLLVLELFGSGNIILVGENGKILQALTYKQMRDRNILRDETFLFAPSASINPKIMSRDKLHDNLKNSGDTEIVKALIKLVGTGGLYVEEVLLRAEVDKTTPCNTLTEDKINSIFDCLQTLLEQVTCGDLEPMIILDDRECFVDVTPIRLTHYESGSFQHRPYSRFNEALDEFYANVDNDKNVSSRGEVGILEREAKRLNRMIAEQEKAIAEIGNKAMQDKHVGDLIYANSGEFQVLLDKFSVNRQSGRDWKAIAVEISREKTDNMKPSTFFEAFDERSQTIRVRTAGLTFGLDMRKTVFENASRFYENGKRARQKLVGARIALDDSRKKLGEIEEKICKTKTPDQTKPTETTKRLVKIQMKRKEWFEKFRWFISSDSFLVVAGRDAVSNEVLIKKHTETEDIIFHADILGAPFVVVKTEKKQPTEQCLREAAEFAAAFSRGWREGFGSVDVYWVKPDQLSKGGPSGESVPHGAFVVCGKRNWIRGVPLKLAVGAITEDSAIRFVGGPIDSVKAKTTFWTAVSPGNEIGKQMLKHVLTSIAKKASERMREAIVNASIEEIRNFIPFGTANVLIDGRLS